MKGVYPAVFTEVDGALLVEVPDLEILTEGKDFNNAIEMARDAIELKCVSMEDGGEEIPKPSDVSTIDLSKTTFSGPTKWLRKELWTAAISKEKEESRFTPRTVRLCITM